MCRSCASKAQATAQWASEQGRAKKMSALKSSGARRRRLYADLELRHFNSIRYDGRAMASYWTPEGGKAYCYRSRWVWEQANGDIPDGWHVHHKNGDCSDDRLENLEALPAEAHLKLHMSRDKAVSMVLARGATLREHSWITCEKCGIAFFAPVVNQHGRPRKYCSRACAGTEQPSTISK